jgi:hypothetical protein
MVNKTIDNLDQRNETSQKSRFSQGGITERPSACDGYIVQKRREKRRGVLYNIRGVLFAQNCSDRSTDFSLISLTSSRP